MLSEKRAFAVKNWLKATPRQTSRTAVFECSHTARANRCALTTTEGGASANRRVDIVLLSR